MFDTAAFKPAAFLKRLPLNSPKLTKLLENIARIDKSDQDRFGKTFKHFIFSDLERGFGVKIIGSALVAAGFSHAIKKSNSSMALVPATAGQLGQRFAVLTKSTMYGQTVTTVLKKSVLSAYNARPTNVHGEEIRIIVLDRGFKEGIDLFDVRYVHIFEPQMSKAEMQQVIGRATRTCGQKGLTFVPNIGWPLDVYVYDVRVTTAEKDRIPHDTLFQMLYENSGFDIRRLNLAAELTESVVGAAVDAILTAPLHNSALSSIAPSQSGTSYKSLLRTMVGGARKKNPPVFNCGGKCGARPTRDIPLKINALVAVAMAMKNPPPIIVKKGIRAQMCAILSTDENYCKLAIDMHNDPIRFSRQYATTITNNMLRAKLPKVMQKQILTMLGIVPFAKILKDDPHPLPPPSPRVSKSSSSKSSPLLLKNSPYEPFAVAQINAANLFPKLTWPKVKVESACGDNIVKASAAPSTAKSPVIATMHPTQQFVSQYFTPSSPVKGMLLYHGTGVGKTGTAIATASSGFEEDGYTILWVTRTTLREDIWKNMFELVFHKGIADKINSGHKLPSGKEGMKLLSKSWDIRPLSYRQFSNLVEKKNSIYQRVVDRNGQADPLRKTLLVIDEAHKLFGGGADLSTTERPNSTALRNAIHNSYKISGDNSVRLLLMTATPFTNDPMEMISLLNLLKPADDQIPDDFDEFTMEYLDHSGRFAPGKQTAFMNRITGLVSFLDRSKDPRQFAQPTVHHIDAHISTLTTSTVPSIKHAKLANKDIAMLIKHAKELYKYNCDKEKLVYNALRENKSLTKQKLKEMAAEHKKILKEFKNNLETSTQMYSLQKQSVSADRKLIETNASQTSAIIDRCD
jgi:superfamily II DNA or RNA helicase